SNVSFTTANATHFVRVLVSWGRHSCLPDRHGRQKCLPYAFAPPPGVTFMQPQPITNEATPFDDGALYDILLGQIDYGNEFYRDLVRAANGPVLDVACGTGRVLLPCLQAGVDIEGLDLFPAMLDQLRKKAAALGLRPTLHEADMRSFRLERRYALI